MRSGLGRRRPSLRQFVKILDSFLVDLPADPPVRQIATSSFGCNGAASIVRASGQVELRETHVPSVQIGETFVAPVSGRALRIDGLAGEGTRAKVYRATELESGRTYALKVIHEYAPLYLHSVAVEIPKIEVLAEHQMPFAMILEQGKTYLIKEWLDGVSGEHWLEQWLRCGADPDDQAFVKLIGFFREASIKGLHIEDLRPSNLMLRNATGDWVPIDTGPIQTSVAPRLAMRLYRERFVRKWLRTSRSIFWNIAYWFWCRMRGEGGAMSRRQRRQFSLSVGPPKSGIKA